MTTVPSLTERLKFVSEIKNVPALPHIVNDVLKKMDGYRTTPKDLAAKITLDPGLVASILRDVNSPLFGLKAEVMTITRAITILGEERLRTMIMSYGIESVFRSTENRDMQKQLWTHSVSTGILSQVISESVYKESKSRFYIYGLLHDIGKILLLNHDEKKFFQSRQLNLSTGCGSADAEYRFYKFSHIECGYFLLTRYGFSTEAKRMLLLHHDPEFSSPKEKYIWIVNLADILANRHAGNSNPEGIEKAQKKLKLSDRKLEKIIETATVLTEEILSPPAKLNNGKQN